VTVESMKLSFKLEPQGLPPRWPAGEHQAASVRLVAEQFCLGCHVKAQVGDVLGTVTVRSYLVRKESGWWQEVRLTAAALSLKIVIHTIVLFLLLKVRMEPLLRLRATVAGLAKGVMDLAPRAQVKSEDEFAELALDLNHFLDRITLVVRDLDRILAEVVTVGVRLGTLNRHLEQQLDDWRGAAQRHGAQDAQRTLDTQSVAAREAGAFDTLMRLLDEFAAAGLLGDAAGVTLRTHLQRLGGSFHTVARAVREAAPPAAVAQEQALQYQAFAQSLREMALLEASMQKVAESGQAVLQRLARGRQGDGGAGLTAAAAPAAGPG